MLFPVTVEQRVDAAILAIAGLVLLTVPPWVTDGQQLVFWSDLLLLALSVLASFWVLRRPPRYASATSPPAGALVASTRSVIRREATWGLPYVLLALIAAVATPEFFGFGFACLVVASALALGARDEARRQESGGYRLYRGKSQRRFRGSRPMYRRLEPAAARPDL